VRCGAAAQIDNRKPGKVGNSSNGGASPDGLVQELRKAGTHPHYPMVVIAGVKARKLG
jgi:hypothetical protein